MSGLTTVMRGQSFVRLLIFCALALAGAAEVNAQASGGRVVMDIPGYPVVFELNEGEDHTISRSYKGRSVERTIRLISVKHFAEDNLWFSGDLGSENYSKAEVVIEVSGKRVTLLHRPYESPRVVNGLRVYVETTKEWAENAAYADLKDVARTVRLSVCLEGEPWGPVGVLFPISAYRWRSAVYNNTWSGLVPYNQLYYHRGEDYGAIPDRLDVVAPVDGTIVGTPLPDGDGQSNAIFVANADSIVFRISHMNTETIRKEYTKGTRVTAGTVLAKTGMTWSGRKSQVSDPHCHIDINYRGTKLASFPYLIEAYLRRYDDPVLAVAGGYQFAMSGTKVTLDANRSLAGAGEKIASYAWKLHNGKTVRSPVTRLKYDKPGVYTEELIVTTESGAQDRDFVQVRIYEEAQNRSDLSYGWAFYSPVRNIMPGTEVLFWNRLVRTNAPVTIDFGDGSAAETIGRELTHTYKNKGNYTVTLSSRDKGGNPVTVKLEVKVE